ncbi:VapE domain-containing protein [Leptolyngbya sp. FACHB-17]|uniref:VapE domain-containing protein n=1 Tax=unclassified Leptolyngbya TaxID=2650499 RepID=UPI001680E387|nr:VapE domain-containing protein [Leptolyngbya sp. FACHB-17]MBD2079320.1 hypothetical protein [Leptolyngbya sp. FACHB-17]
MSHISLFATSTRHPDKANGATWEVDGNKKAKTDLRGYILSEDGDRSYKYWEVFQQTMIDNGLKMNSWNGTIELEGKPGKYTQAQLLSAFEDELSLMCKLTTESFTRKFNILCEQRQFNPVIQYLEGLVTKAKEGNILCFGDWMLANNSDRNEYEAYVRSAKYEASRKPVEAWEGWSTLAKDVLGVDDELSQEMFTSWLIGAVARAVDPGCQMRQCLTLQGAQEIGKTQVLKALAGEYYSSRDSEMSDADVYRQLQSCWIMELEEIEAIASKRSVENLKRFISVQEDEYRHLYQNEVRKHPRHSVLAATANSTNFLRDEDNTRFWVIPVPGEINVEYVRCHRDNIWLEAYRRYLTGEKPWNKELSRKASERAKGFTADNELLETLEAVLAKMGDKGAIALAPKDILAAVFNVTPSSRQYTPMSRKLSSAMDTLGYTQKERRVSGVKARYYFKPENADSELTLVTCAQLEQYRHNSYA